MDITDDGVIVGTTYPLTSPSTGFVWDGETFQVFGTPSGGVFSEATAINNRQECVGYWGPGPLLTAFQWHGGTITSLANVLIPGESLAYDISDSGVITGYMGGTTFPPNHRAFIWKNGKVTDLGLGLPGAYATESRGVNDKGQACGVWWSASCCQVPWALRAFFWDGKALHDLPRSNVFPGFPEAVANDINNQAQIVGKIYVEDQLGGHPCLWDDRRMYVLPPMMLTDLELAFGEPQAINDLGQIIVHAHIQSNGPTTDGLLLTPVPPTPGDTNCDTVVNVTDLLNVIGHWREDGGRPDVNDDGIVDHVDLLEVIRNWSSAGAGR